MKIEEIGEFGLIERLKGLVPAGKNVVAGIGDDAAVLSGWKPGKYLLVATDTIAEGVHFRRSAGSRRIGRKSLAVNLSDIAAMGGKPLWAVVNLGLPPHISLRLCRELYEGLAGLAEEFSIGIVGGDTFRSPQGLCLSVTVVGEVERKKCVFRKGAKPGDVVCLTGELGSGGKKHLDFIPRLKEGRFLTGKFSPSAMIDISDGLFADLGKLCRAGKVGAVIGEEAFPFPKGLRPRSRRGVLRAACRGEEFELLFTLPEKEVEKLLKEFPRLTKTKVTPIGRVVRGRDKLVSVDGKGREHPIVETGYDHFSRANHR